MSLFGCLFSRTSSPGGPTVALPAEGAVVLLLGPDGLLAVDPDQGTVTRWTPAPADSAAEVLAAPHARYGYELLSFEGKRYKLSLPAGGHDPSLSPDGTTLAYTLDKPDMAAQVRLVGLDGTKDRALTDAGASPTWLPDGTIGLRNGGQVAGDAIFRLNPDGTGITQVAREADRAVVSLDWSPDGASVVYATRAPGARAGERQTAIWWSDGQTTRALATPPSGGDATVPRFSPDGARVALLWQDPHPGERRAPTNLAVVSVPGGEPRALLDLEAKEARFLPGGAYAGVVEYAWSPDSRRLAFLAALEGDCRKEGNGDLICKYDLYVVGADGSGMKRVTKLGLKRASAVVWAR